MTQAPEHALLDLLRTRRMGVLATLKRDGRPQLSNVAYTYDAAARLIRIPVTEDRAKTRNLRRDPRASFHVASEDFWAYAVAEGIVELPPVAADLDDATVEELIGVFRVIRGTDPDSAQFRAAMVADRRIVVRLHVQQTYGGAGA